MIGWSMDGKVVLFDPDEGEDSAQFIMTSTQFDEWSSQILETNRRHGAHSYPRLATTADIACEFVRSLGEWCVWHQGHAKMRFHFTRQEVEALLDWMGSDESANFASRTPVVASAR